MQEFHLDVIGTHIRIVIDESLPIGEDFSHIQKRLQEFDARYSRFISGNWIHRLNRDRRNTLDDDARKMLDSSLELARVSDGYFDPTIGKKLAELGYKNPELDNVGIIKNTWKNVFYGNYKDIEIIWDEVVLNGDIELEFGWIGKGYMLEWITNYLSKYSRYIIDFGGDIYGKWWWQVGLENPDNIEEAIGILTLHDGYFACSSGVKRKWWNHHHLIDPHTGNSAQEVKATYIESFSGTLSDGYATTLCVMPFILACETLWKNPEIEGIILSSRWEIYQSKGSKCELFS
jgi:thiamine biosynthesis lipoprotein